MFLKLILHFTTLALIRCILLHPLVAQPVALTVAQPVELTVAQTAGQESTSVASPVTIQFSETILPILQNRCFECHSAENSEGDLRLDSLTEMQKGGHSGNAILAEGPAESELFRRITSDEIGYRMPKEGDALSPSEIELMHQWIAEGAKWPAVATPAVVDRTWAEYLGDQLNRFDAASREPAYRYLYFLMVPAILWIFLALLSFYASFRARKTADASPPSWPASLTYERLLLSLAGLAAIGGLLFQFGTIQQLTESNQNLNSRLNVSPDSVPVSFDPQNLTLPIYPMHPRRLGGIYYRGNDERSPSLFNGGFYRTATMEVQLVDEHGNKMQWNDPIGDSDWTIQLSIARAPGTTPALFSDQVLQSTYLRHIRQSSLNEESIPREQNDIKLKNVDPHQMWIANIELPRSSNWKNGIAEGMIYLFYGNQMIDGEMGRVHFGIKYKIELVAGKISSTSEIWMGSLYNLNGRVLIPYDKNILLDRWFDFRPIPEIEGENTSDPMLLGIPEHVE